MTKLALLGAAALLSAGVAMPATAQEVVYNPGYCAQFYPCLLYTSPSPRDGLLSRMPSSA